MKVSTQRLPESQVLLEIEVDSDQLEKSFDKAYRKLVQRVNIPGFRKGKAPRSTLERHVGHGRLLEEAIDIVVPEAYNEALESEDIDAIGQPEIEMLSVEPLSFKATVPIRPTVDLGDYQSVRVPREPVEIDPNDVDTSLQQLRRRYAVHEPVERAVQIGDIIRGDVKIVVDDREVFKDDDVELHLHDDQHVLLPGFKEGVVGVAKGEPKTIEVTIPEDAGSALAGKTATIDVHVKEVKEERLPEPDDEFAQGVGEGFPNSAALIERLENDIRERLVSRAEEDYREAALTTLVENAETMEFPPVLVDREIQRFMQEQARNTGMELDKYLELIKQTPMEVAEQLRPSATERVKRSLALSRLAEDEKIEVEEADIDLEIENIVAQASAANPEQVERYRTIFQSPEARASLSRSLITRKTMDRLIEIASQTDGKSPAKKKAKSTKAAAKKTAEATEEAS